MRQEVYSKGKKIMEMHNKMNVANNKTIEKYATRKYIAYSRHNVQVTLPLFSTYFNDCDHSSLIDNMFTALKSC